VPKQIVIAIERRSRMTGDTLAARFDAERPRLVTLAARVLDSRAEAEEVVQDAWLRLAGADADGIANLGGWLSTVVARAAIDRLRQRRWRAETPLDDRTGPAMDFVDHAPGPEAELMLADAVGAALVVVLDRLGPAERLAFVLHDLFGLQMPAGGALEGIKARADIVAAFAKASREGRMEDLVRLLDPDVTLTLDPAALPRGALTVILGAAKVAARARAGAQLAAADVMLIAGEPGLVIATDGKVQRVLTFAIAEGQIAAIEVTSDPERLARLELRLLDRLADQAH
jgi:RNA polymerase sigma factor (sigma-70 family)